MSRAIDRAADEVVVLPDHLERARRKIADHPVDILFYPDVGMDPLTYFLAFSRLASLQCVTWGHPVTTGIPSIDYYLSFENSEPPDANDHYSEQLVLLKRFVMYCFRPQLPKAPRFRSDFDLPEGCNLYVCPQMLFKFHPDFDRILRDILRQDPNGLIVLSEGVCRNWTELLSKRFAQVFPQDIDRVKFLPYLPFNDFLSLLQMADVMLDTIHFNGGFTSLLAFACDLPIITLPGRFMRGRLTLAMYKQMGIMDCVAEDAESYVKIALRLTNERKWREEIVKKISTRCDVLFEDMEAVRELERFFERAVSSA
jgi:predicted O-linked N-acetylglucosamine transferase (SPINDLY family)